MILPVTIFYFIYINSLNYDNSKGWKFFSFYRTESTGSGTPAELFKVIYT